MKKKQLFWLVSPVFLISLEFPIIELWHIFFAPFLGQGYLMLHPLSWIAVTTFFLCKYDRCCLLEWWMLVGLACLVVGTLIAVFWGRGDFIAIDIQYLWFGILSIFFGMILFMSIYREKLILAFVSGLSLWADLSVFSYLWSRIILLTDFPYLGSYSWDQYLIAMRFPGNNILSKTFHDELIGNFNKAANYIVLGILLLCYLFSKKTVTFRVALILYLPLSFLFVIVMSRGALLCGLGIVFIAALLLSLRIFFGKKNDVRLLLRLLIILCLFFGLPLAISLSTQNLRDYWEDTSTIHSRIQQWSGIYKYSPLQSNFSRYSNILVGMGPGEYGVRNFGSAIAGTHNLWLDILNESGALGLLGFVLIFFKAISSSLKLWLKKGAINAFFSILGLVVIAVIGLREYSLSYLYVTALGGFFVGCFSSLGRELNFDY